MFAVTLSVLGTRSTPVPSKEASHPIIQTNVLGFMHPRKHQLPFYDAVNTAAVLGFNFNEWLTLAIRRLEKRSSDWLVSCRRTRGWALQPSYLYSPYPIHITVSDAKFRSVRGPVRRGLSITCPQTVRNYDSYALGQLDAVFGLSQPSGSLRALVYVSDAWPAYLSCRKQSPPDHQIFSP